MSIAVMNTDANGYLTFYARQAIRYVYDLEYKTPMSCTFLILRDQEPVAKFIRFDLKAHIVINSLQSF